MKTLTTSERIGRVGQRRQVVIPREILEGLNRARKPAVDPDDTLTPAEEKIGRRGEAACKREESKSWRDVKNALSL